MSQKRVNKTKKPTRKKKTSKSKIQTVKKYKPFMSAMTEIPKKSGYKYYRPYYTNQGVYVILSRAGHRYAIEAGLDIAVHSYKLLGRFYDSITEAKNALKKHLGITK